MKLTSKKYEVSEGEEFGEDILKRRPFGESLCNLVKRSETPLVIGLNGHWGEGKTTFVKMWQGLLSKENIPNVYIDAFENDYLEDAFMVVASSINDYIEKEVGKEKSENFAKIAARVGVQTLSFATKIGIRIASLGIIKDDDFKEVQKIAEDISKDLSNSAESFIKKRLQSHSEEKKTIQDFKALLSEIPGQISESFSNETPSFNHPLVIIVDELDRCRPNFAVELLEKIKHLFSVENVVFVLVMNKNQLEESIRTTYGPNIDAHTYLQKFISVEASIPKRITGDDNDISAYTKYLIKSHDLDDENNEILATFEALAKHFSMTFRQLEKSFSNFALLTYTVNLNSYNIDLMCIISTIKATNPSIYQKLLKGKISYGDFFESVEYIKNEKTHSRIDYTMDWVKLSLMSEDEYRALDHNDDLYLMMRRHRGARRTGALEYYLNALKNFTIK